MKYEIIKRDNTSETQIDQGECETYEDALEIYIDCIIDHSMDDSWLMEDYTRIKSGRNAMRYAKILGWLKKNKTLAEQFITPTKGKPYEIELKVSGEEKEQYEDDLFAESWDPDYDDKPENQWGEKWQQVGDTYLGQCLRNIMEDVQIDHYQDGPKLESLSLGSLHICEDGHLIATIYGGANGGGFRGIESNWPFYISLVRKLLGKILDYDNGKTFKDVWLIDWDNDCCDDVWTLRLGLGLSDEEKVHLIECGKKFSVVDPTKLDVSLDSAMELVDPSMNDPIQVANCAATVSESRKFRRLRSK